MDKRISILGAGMQGTAAAYDLVRFAEASPVRLADYSFEQAERSAARVNSLVGRTACEPHQVDALDESQLAGFLEGADVVLSCVPYWMHPKIAPVAIRTGTSMCDLGGNTEVTLRTLALNDAAAAAGVTLVPDCGLAPGLVNSVGLWLIEHLDQPDSVKLYCGVLPQNPVPPFNYKLTFNIEGLVTEYDYQAVVLRNGNIVHVDTLAELERLKLEELGEMEAFTTSGGTSTAPYTHQSVLKNYEYKTIRFPGHCERMRIFKDFGFWGESPVDVKGTAVMPKDLFNRVFGDALKQFVDRDQCAIRGIGTGRRGGHDVTLQIDIFDRQCETTGFTSMERLTGFSLSIIAQHVAAGGVRLGAVRYEEAMTGSQFLDELQRRDIRVRFSEETLSISA